MTRREAREQAFMLLFEHTFRPEEQLEQLVANAALTRELELDDYTTRTYEGAVQLWDELGTILEQYLRNWKLDRISRVAIVVLRLALYEMRCESTVPTAAAINEAVELAKKYSGAEDASFVNGVLGAVARADGASLPETAPEEADEAQPAQ